MNTYLLAIDCQVDFCDPKGKLYIQDSEFDMARLGLFIYRKKAEIDRVYLTLDSHHPIHIAHPIFWKDKDGRKPTPRTQITVGDVLEGKWIAARESYKKWAENYVIQLDKNKREPLTIWNPHCLIGTVGHTVLPVLMDALIAWQESTFKTVDYVMKGSCFYTEHYSAIGPEVSCSELGAWNVECQPEVNTQLVADLSKADRIVIAGEAGSHCVYYTVMDLLRLDKSFADKIILLKDCISPVPGFEKRQKELFSKVKVSTSKDFV